MVLLYQLVLAVVAVVVVVALVHDCSYRQAAVNAVPVAVEDPNCLDMIDEEDIVLALDGHILAQETYCLVAVHLAAGLVAVDHNYSDIAVVANNFLVNVVNTVVIVVHGGRVAFAGGHPFYSRRAYAVDVAVLASDNYLELPYYCVAVDLVVAAGRLIR